ncbi:hypothetical protein D7Y26_22765 [Stenotrophomonas maltophilia]|nr:hypothetical protein [Stenotrophomonas maltophilia]MBA0326426.1 hypothetical protein [Stenotrophomonas maltophilia]
MAALLLGQPTLTLTFGVFPGFPPATLLCRKKCTVPALGLQVGRLLIAGFDAFGFFLDGVSHRVPGLQKTAHVRGAVPLQFFDLLVSHFPEERPKALLLGRWGG